MKIAPAFLLLGLSMISKKAKYAINALVYLAREYGKGPVQISQIAESESIPQKFLEAILLELKKDGILNSKKGKGGGYSLQKHPDSVNIAEIMRLMDGPIALLPCVSYKFYQRCEECRDEASCGIREVFLSVRNQTVAMLKDASLTSIMHRGDALSTGQ
jgi:Rrf2 family protein